jgi:hypothetical protein
LLFVEVTNLGWIIGVPKKSYDFLGYNFLWPFA